MGLKNVEQSDYDLLVERNIKKISKISEKFKDYLKSLKSYEQIDKMDYPKDLYLSNARAMATLILVAFYQKSANNEKNLQKKTRVSDIRAEGVEISWDLEDTKALHAFRCEAFQVSGVQCDTLRAKIKKSAEKAFTEGATYDDWLDEITLDGFEVKNPHYLRTNFRSAVDNARAAARWHEMQELADVFPYLCYETAGDEAVRESHKVLDGVVLPINDSFWDTYYPPNGWNCRCTVEQLSDGEAEDEPKFGNPAPTIAIDSAWQKNTGQDNQIWDKWLDEQEKPVMTPRELNLPKNEDLPAHKKPSTPDTSVFTEIDVTRILDEYLGERITADKQKDPVRITAVETDNLLANKTKAQKQACGAYVNEIDNVLVAPDETWQDSTNMRLSYLRKYTGNMYLLVEIEEGRVVGFDALESPSDEVLEMVRKGIYMG